MVDGYNMIDWITLIIYLVYGPSFILMFTLTEKMVEGYNMVDITLIIYLVYGTSFILMFLLTTIWRKRVANIKLMEGFQYLTVFGLIHGLAEYFAIPRILGWQTAWIFDIVKLILIASSFTALLAFGLNIITVAEEKRLWIRGLPYGALLMYFWLLIFIVFTININYDVAYNVAELAARYSLGFLGAGISSYAFLYLSDKMKALAGENAGNSLFIAGMCFGLYAIFGGLIVSTVIGIPVVIFRSAIAVLMTISVIQIFELFRAKKTVK
jgi:hypothetical protein